MRGLTQQHESGVSDVLDHRVVVRRPRVEGLRDVTNRLDEQKSGFRTHGHAGYVVSA